MDAGPMNLISSIRVNYGSPTKWRPYEKMVII
jgi:hypothetical protein